MSDAPRPRGHTFHIHYRLTLPSGEVVVARIHGDGGVISSTSTTRGLYRLRIAQARVLAGKPSGMAEPRATRAAAMDPFASAAISAKASSGESPAERKTLLIHLVGKISSPANVLAEASRLRAVHW